jgi:Tol biopolymer transport system component
MHRLKPLFPWIGAWIALAALLIFLASMVTAAVRNSYNHDQWPVWSPDGKSIAFVSHRNGELHYYLIHPDGTGLKQLSDKKAAEQSSEPCLSWSLDGKRIAFFAEGASSDEIYAINSDGTGEALLAPNLNIHIYSCTLAWSPDGSTILVWTDSYKFLLIDSSGATAGEPIAGGDPVWSPTGKQVAFDVMGADANDELFVIREVGGEPFQLMKGEGDVDLPSWSPDGKQISFLCNYRYLNFLRKYDICLINPDGSGLEHFAAEATRNPLSWSPDGHHIAYISDTKVVVISVGGAGKGASKELTNRPIEICCLAWSMDGKTLLSRGWSNDSSIYVEDITGAIPSKTFQGGEAAWSPDGGRIAYVANAGTRGGGITQQQIMIANADGSNPRNLSINHTQYALISIGFGLGAATLLILSAKQLIRKNQQKMLSPQKLALSSFIVGLIDLIGITFLIVFGFNVFGFSLNFETICFYWIILFLISITAIVLGIRALGQIKQNLDGIKWKVLAWFGIILGVLTIMGLFVVFSLSVVRI